MSIELAMPSNHLILCHSLLLLPSIFSSIRIFFNELALHMRSPKYWSFSITINPSNEYLGLISFKIDLFDLAVQGTLKTLLQHHSLKASILYDSTLRFIHDYWRYHSLDYMDLCWQTDFFNFFFNTPSRFFTAFWPGSNRLLITWLQSPSAVILEPMKKKSVAAFTFSPSICHEEMGPYATISVF